MFLRYFSKLRIFVMTKCLAGSERMKDAVFNNCLCVFSFLQLVSKF